MLLLSVLQQQHNYLEVVIAAAVTEAVIALGVVLLGPVSALVPTVTVVLLVAIEAIIAAIQQ